MNLTDQIQAYYTERMNIHTFKGKMTKENAKPYVLKDVYWHFLDNNPMSLNTDKIQDFITKTYESSDPTH
jgi:hypothetical protein